MDKYNERRGKVTFFSRFCFVESEVSGAGHRLLSGWCVLIALGSGPTLSARKAIHTLLTLGVQRFGVALGWATSGRVSLGVKARPPPAEVK